ncbi:MAG: hypothetical protein ACTSRK_11730 [Promethearchaeota archaeon]
MDETLENFIIALIFVVSMIGLIIAVNFVKRSKIRRKINVIKHQFKELNDISFESYSKAVKEVKKDIDSTIGSLGDSINFEMKILVAKMEKIHLNRWEKSLENDITGYENRVEYHNDMLEQLNRLRIYQIKTEKQKLRMKLTQIMNQDRNIHIKKTVLEQGSQFARLEVPEIAEVCGINKPDLIIAILNEMIADGEIHARYFESTQSVSFNQQANLEELNRLDDLFGEWREKEILKIDKI